MVENGEVLVDFVFVGRAGRRGGVFAFSRSAFAEEEFFWTGLAEDYEFGGAVAQKGEIWKFGITPSLIPHPSSTLHSTLG